MFDLVGHRDWAGHTDLVAIVRRDSAAVQVLAVVCHSFVVDHSFVGHSPAVDRRVAVAGCKGCSVAGTVRFAGHMDWPRRRSCHRLGRSSGTVND